MQKAKTLWEMLRFAINGGICFLIDWGLMVGLKELLGISVLWASAISFTVSVFVNYVICVKWVFHGAKNSGFTTTFLFLATSLVGLGINQLMMWALDGLGIDYRIAKVFATLVVMVWNYFTKRWSLRRTNNES